MEAIAKHDFTATADDELSFRKMQILKVNQRVFCSPGYFSSAVRGCSRGWPEVLALVGQPVVGGDDEGISPGNHRDLLLF